MQKKYLYLAGLGLALILLVVIAMALMPEQDNSEPAAGNQNSSGQLDYSQGADKPDSVGPSPDANSPGASLPDGVSPDQDLEDEDPADKDQEEDQEEDQEDEDLTEGEASEEDDSKEEAKGSVKDEQDSLPNLLDLDFTNLKFQVAKQKGKIDVTHINDQLYFDLETLARYYGKKFDWDTDDQGREQFFIRLFGVNIESAHLSESAKLNGKDSDLGDPVYKLSHRTLIPADALAGHLGAKFEPDFDEGIMDIKFTNIFKALATVFN